MTNAQAMISVPRRRNVPLETNERYTPKPVVAGGAAFCGVDAFDLDAAACAESHHAPKYFTVETDGLAQQWFGAVWLNPPYDDIAPWAAKAVAEVASGRALLVCMLVPATRTEQAWWQEHVECRTHAAVDGVRAKVKNLKGRTKFIAPGGKVLGKPKFGCCYVVFTRDLETIKRQRGRPRAVNADLLRRGRELLAEGMSISSMVLKLGVARESWYRATRPSPLRARQRDRRAVPASIERKVTRLRREGLTMRAISERLGVHINTVNKYLRPHRRAVQVHDISEATPNPP